MCEDGIDLEYWTIKEQTLMKHMVINDYITHWITILGKYNNMSIFDCYAGNGIYRSKEGEIYYGSPILIARIIENYFNKTGKLVNFIVVEKNKKNYNNLLKVLEKEELLKYCTVYNDDFNDIFDSLIAKHKMDANLFFIDPFGYKIDFRQLKIIMSLKKSEIILNFMYNYINRFLNDETQIENMNRLFGCNEWKHIGDSDKEVAITSLYSYQCRLISKFVFPFRLCFSDKNRTFYYLYHLTNNSLGAKIMKSSFAKFNNGKIEYLGKLKDQITLLDILKTEETKQYLLDLFEGDEQTFGNIIDITIDLCPYLEKDIRAAIKELESEKKVVIERYTKSKTGLNGDTLIKFIG